MSDAPKKNPKKTGKVRDDVEAFTTDVAPSQPTTSTGTGIKVDVSKTDAEKSIPSSKTLRLHDTSSLTSRIHLPHFNIDRRPPAELGKCHRFKRYIWNKEEGLVLGRTPLSWLKVIVYYVTFMVFIYGLMIISLYLITEYIRKEYKTPVVPKTLASVILSAPKNALIWYDTSKNSTKRNAPNTHRAYVRSIDNLLKKYDEAETKESEFSNCEVYREPTKPCLFHRQSMGPCGEKELGFDDKKPCIYVKLNKLANWEPEYYDNSSLPDEMPNSLKAVIAADPNKEKVWVHCDGVNAYDAEHIGDLTYYPSQGVMGYYFPFSDQKDYLTPLVAVKFNEIKSGLIIHIQCTIWAKNINVEDVNNYASHVQLYI